MSSPNLKPKTEWTGTGQVFGYLTVIQDNPCLVRCVCGKEYALRRAVLLNGNSRSCGCRKGAMISRSKVVHGAAKRGDKAPEWAIWADMNRRCREPEKYPYHAGKGIQVCDKWRDDFAAFLGDVGPRPSPRHSIDRIDGSKNYEPGNVRWATTKEQSQNRSNVRWYTHDGITLCMADWARRIGVSSSQLGLRIKSGWPIEVALSAPPNSTPRRRAQ